jgi:hypothetical protein
VNFVPQEWTWTPGVKVNLELAGTLYSLFEWMGERIIFIPSGQSLSLWRSFWSIFFLGNKDKFSS